MIRNRGLNKIAMQTRFGRTVDLVEKRIRDKRSDDPIKDLGFLSEHYRSRCEWDKANAATRHMLALAEGNTNSVFEITPIDIGLYQANKLSKHCSELRVWFALIAALLVTIGTYDAIDQYQNDPRFLLDLRSNVFPRDPQSFVDRAAYFFVRSNPFEALKDCDRALKLDPKNSAALQRKSFVLYEMGNLKLSSEVNEMSSHASAFYFWNKMRIEQATGDFAAAAASCIEADKIEPSANNKYNIAYEFARSGNFSKALEFAHLETVNAKDNSERMEGLAMESRYLLRLHRYDEAVVAASKSIECDASQPLSTAYTYRAQAQCELNKFESALEDATKAISLDYKNYKAYRIRASIFSNLGRADDARSDLIQANVYMSGRNL